MREGATALTLDRDKATLQKSETASELRNSNHLQAEQQDRKHPRFDQPIIDGFHAAKRCARVTSCRCVGCVSCVESAETQTAEIYAPRA